MRKKKISLSEAIKFHGHLGPYLILGVLAGELAVKKLGCERYFGLDVKVWGANKKPKSCLIDGLQLSTGATYGKGNIYKFNGNNIRVLVRSLENKKRIEISFRKELIKDLNNLRGHRDAEVFARKLLNINHSELFEIASLANGKRRLARNDKWVIRQLGIF